MLINMTVTSTTVSATKIDAEEGFVKHFKT
jgi:hypothetical protein